MKKSIVSGFAAAALIGAVGLTPALADMERTVTEKTTTYSGTVTSIEPSTSTIMLRQETSAAPVSYRYTKNTTFVDSAGNVVSQETIKNSPVTVHYVKEGDAMVVTKVVQTQPAVQKKVTTEERVIH